MTHLDELKKIIEPINDSIEAIKIGTESEQMDLPEIAFLMAAVNKPCIAKIGGPEAKADLKRLYRIGITRFLAPMVESGFAVQKFLDAVKTSIGFYNVTELAINLETKTAFVNLVDNSSC